MNEKEFLARLSGELDAQSGADKKQILEQYRLFFEQKRFDGYTDDEICRLLRSPAELANANKDKPRASKSLKALICVGLGATDAACALMLLIMLILSAAIFALCVYLLYAAGAYLAGYTPVHVFKHFNPVFEYYWSGALMGLSLMALSLLGMVGNVYYLTFLSHMMSALGRFNVNTLNEMSHKPILPPVTINAHIKGKLNRRLRNAALLCLIALALCFALSWLTAADNAGARFYETWNWFD